MYTFSALLVDLGKVQDLGVPPSEEGIEQVSSANSMDTCRHHALLYLVVSVRYYNTIQPHLQISRQFTFHFLKYYSRNEIEAATQAQASGLFKRNVLPFGYF